MSCENLDLESLCDSDYIEHSFSLYLNNEQLLAIEFLEKRKKKTLVIDYAACLLRVFNSLITLDRKNIVETSLLLRDVEKKCIAHQPGWIKSIKKLFRSSRDFTHRKSIIDEIERDIIQLAFSFLPPHFKLINLFGYQGDRDVGLNCLHECHTSSDFRSILAVVGLLWYYLVLRPFFVSENAELTEDIAIATAILNEYEQFDQSALFLFFSGRRQRLKRKIKYAIIHYDTAIRCKNIPRELKILVMNELGVCLLSELNYHDAMHYFNELKVSRFSKTYYMYLMICCKGAFEGSAEEFHVNYDGLLKVINGSSQKDGVVDKFIQNRCILVFPKTDSKSEFFWQLLCFEVMYFWGFLGGCTSNVLERIINACKDLNQDDEPIYGLCNFMIATCFNLLKDIQSAILYYRKCIDECKDNNQAIKFTHIPAYANFELSSLLFKFGNADDKLDAQKLLQHAKQFKNYDFEGRLKLKMQNVKPENC